MFREFILTLIEHQKQFLVLGNLSAVHSGDIFPFIKSNALWLGHNHSNMWFKIPESYPLTDSQFKTDNEGNRYISFASIRWFTNLKSSKKKPFLPLTKSYSSESYRKFVNYDKAINVDKICDIPADYTGEMGVPLTFLDKHNPEQFEVIAIPIAGCIKYTGYKPRYILYGRDKGKIANYRRCFLRSIQSRT